MKKTKRQNKQDGNKGAMAGLVIVLIIVVIGAVLFMRGGKQGTAPGSQNAGEANQATKQSVSVVSDALSKKFGLVETQVSKAYPTYQYGYARDSGNNLEFSVSQEKGFKITISSLPEEAKNWSSPTETQYTWVSEWPEQCKAGCTGTVYSVNGKDAKYLVRVHVTEFDKAQLAKVVDEVFRALEQ